MKKLYSIGNGQPRIATVDGTGNNYTEVVIAAVPNKKIVPVWTLIYFTSDGNQEECKIRLYFTTGGPYMMWDLYLDSAWTSQWYQNFGLSYLTDSPVNDSITVASADDLGLNVLRTLIGYYLVDA